MKKRTTKTNLKGKEVKMMKKIVFITMMCLMLSIGATAQAFWVGDVCDGLGNCVSNVMGFDWSSSGSGLATGLGPFGTPFPPDTPFDFLYQAQLVGLTDPAGQPLTFPGLNTDFEFTVAAIVPETGFIFPLSGTLFQGIFTTQPGGVWAIFYDAPKDAIVANGTGFVDGDMVAYGTINAGQISTFLANTASGQGIGSAILEGLVDYANPLYLDVASIIFDFRFEGTLNYPPLDSTTTQFFGPGGIPVTANDLLLKVDGSSKFSVPEPSTILLLGIGLLGLGGLSRKRIRK
jgi:hypothetical protein